MTNFISEAAKEIKLDIKRTKATHIRCILCSEARNIQSVSRQMRYDVMKQSRVFIPNGGRVCPNHRENQNWSDAAVYFNFSQVQIQEMVDLLRKNIPTTSRIENSVQFNRDMKCDTGLSDVQFNMVFLCVPLLRENFNFKEKPARIALHMFLMRLRKGINYEDIGNIFGVSRTTASKNIDKARVALKQEFVPLHLGFENLTREYVLENTTTTARALYIVQ